MAAAPVFSLTKMLVATAVLRLVEADRMSLADDVALRVPLCPTGITVRQLLGHSSGLADYATDARYLDAVAAQPGVPWPLNRVAALVDITDRWDAGWFRYSNYGYWLLGALLEDMTGEPLRVTLQRLVLNPAGMASSFYPAPVGAITAHGYSTLWAGPAGAAWSTPDDITRFLSRLTNGLISSGSLRDMTLGTRIDGVGSPWCRAGYGLGLMVDDELAVVGHGGSGPGFEAAGFCHVATGRAAAVIAPSGSGVDPTAMAFRLLEM